MLTISEFSAAMLFEVVLVLLLMAGYYYFKKKKLIGRTDDAANDRLGLISQKIRELESKKTEFLAAEPLDQRSITICEHWLTMLNAEKHAVEVAGEDRALFWLTAITHTDASLLTEDNNAPGDDAKVAEQAEEIARQVEELARQAEELASQAEQLTEKTEESARQSEEVGKQAEAIASQAEEIAMLKESVENSELQIKNLEKFRSLFFDLKKNLDELQSKNASIVEEIEVSVPDGEKSDTLKRLLADSQQEKEQLQQRIFSIEQELSALLKQAGQIDLGDDSLSGAARDQRQLNPEELFSSIKTDADKIKQMVTKQKLEIAELNNQVNRMQIDVEERNQLVKQIQEIQQRSKELEDVLVILEDENGFLQKQIQELLRTDAEAQANGDTELQTLKQKLHTKERENVDLTQKFSELEAEYLTVYAEAEAMKKAM